MDPRPRIQTLVDAALVVSSPNLNRVHLRSNFVESGLFLGQVRILELILVRDDFPLIIVLRDVIEELTQVAAPSTDRTDFLSGRWISGANFCDPLILGPAVHLVRLPV